MKYLNNIIAILLIAPHVWATEIPHTAKTDLKLGRGYNSSTQTQGQFCLKPVFDIDGSSTSSFKLLSSISQSQLEKELGFGASGKYKTGVTETSASADFLKTTKTNGFSVSYSFRSNYEFPPRALTQYEWTEEAKAQLQILPKEGGIIDKSQDANSWTGKVSPLNLNEWYKKCGDEVITSQNLGARFYINVKVVFSNQQDFQSFSTNFKFNSPTVEAAANFKDEMKKMSSRTNVTVSALQIGGQVDKITGIFQGKAKPLVSCSGGALDQCMQVLESAIEYATDTTPLSEGGEGFPAQIDPNLPTGTYGGPAVLSSVTQRYENITNLQEPSEALQKLSQENERQLNHLFDRLFSDWTYAMQIRQTGLPRLNFEQTQRLTAIETEAYNDLMEVTDAIERCYNNTRRCPEIYSEIDPSERQDMGRIYSEQYLKHIDYEEALKFEAASFAALCDQYQGKMLSRNLEHTVAQLIDVANQCEVKDDNKVCPLDGAEDLCGKAQEVLMGLETLSLRDRDISDLTPFQWFSNLYSLDLSGNNIRSTDLDSLKGLERLERLNLGRNFLKDLGPLAEMDQLVELRINKNQLRDISELGNLDLELLDASSNRGRLECPYTEEDRCLLIDYSRQTSFVTAPSVNAEKRIQGAMLDMNLNYLLLIGGKERSFLELIDKANLSHTPLNMRVDQRMGATFQRVSDNEVLISGGHSLGYSVSRVKINYQTKEAIGESVFSSSAVRYSQESIALEDGRVLIAGGYVKKDFGPTLVVSDAFIYDPATNSFELLESGMKEPRANHEMVKAPSGLIYIFGGKTYTPASGERPSNSIEVFDPKTNQFRWASERMYSPRSGHTATLLDEGTILIAGGFTQTVPSSLSQDVSPEDQRSIKASKTAELFFIDSESVFELPRPMMSGRANHEAIRLESGHILLAGGQVSAASFSNQTIGCGVCENSAEIFDYSKELFIDTGNLMSFPRVHFVLAPLSDNRVYINGGVGEGPALYSEIFSYQNL